MTAMTNQQGAPEALRPIARYKIGYATDDWGTRSSTPGGIPDPAGAWVRYKDHVAALVEAQRPAPSAAADLIAALEEARSAIISMKAEAETAGQGDEQMMLEACETISNEGLQADMAIRAALASAPRPSPTPHAATKLRQVADVMHPHWVSVTDYLPPDETPVLVLRCGAVRIGELRWEHPGHEDSYRSYRYWDDPDDDGQCWEFNEITHWMPLPHPPTTRAAPKPAPVLGYPPLPRVGAIGYASVVDIESYAKTLTIGPHLPGVRDIALWTTDQMRAYVDADRAAHAPADSVLEDAMAWPKPGPQNPTWTICPKFLEKIMRSSASEYMPGLEEIEAVLLGLRTLFSASRVDLPGWESWPPDAHAADSDPEDAARWRDLVAMARNLGVSKQELADLVEAGRTMLQNRL